MKTRYFWVLGTTAVLATTAFAADPVDPNAVAKKTVTSKYYVDTEKQDKLGPQDTNDKAPITGQSISLTSTPGVVGKLYIAGKAKDPLTRKTDAANIGKYVLSGADISTSNGISTTDVENAIVSLRLLQDVYTELSGQITNVSSSIANTMSWSTTGNNNDQIGTDNYSTTFSSSGSGNWPSADQNKLVTGDSLAKGLARKQNKMPCGGWDTTDPNQQNDAHCWLWKVR